MSAAPGPAAKTERLLNLVLVLLYTRRPLPKSRIRLLVPQYGSAASTEAFDRMFERDKDELRELGIPLVTEEIDSLWDDEPGYRIHERDYALSDISFEPDELAVLGLASRTWAQASLAGPAAQALRKLRASGVERDEASLIGIEPRLRTVEPAFDAVKDAVLRRRAHPLRLPAAGAGGARHPPGPALDAGVVAGPVVSQRLRPGPRRAACLPAVPGPQPGRRRRGAGLVRRPRGPSPVRHDPRRHVGRVERRHRDRPGPRRGRPRAASPGHPRPGGRR